MIMQITNELEEVFGPLSKTLFFEYGDIRSLTEYFIKNYRGKLIELLGSGEKEAMAVEDTISSATGQVKKTIRERRQARFLSSGIDKKEVKREREIAIIGISGRYPGARDVEEFWENLRNGRDCITEIPGKQVELEGIL